MIAENELYPVLNMLDVLEKLDIYKYANYFDNVLSDFAQAHVKSPRIAIIGLNPSEESPDNSAFHPMTKSGKAVRLWFKDGSYIVKFVNITHHKNSSPHKPINSKLSMPAVIKFMADCDHKLIS